MGKWLAHGVFALVIGALTGCSGIGSFDGAGIRTIDHMVPHVSTVPAIAGQQVQIFVREKVAAGDATRPVVLLVHARLRRPRSLSMSSMARIAGWSISPVPASTYSPWT